MSQTRAYLTQKTREWRERNPGAGAAAVARWKKANPAGYLLRKSKDRAKKCGLEYELTREWIEKRLAFGCCEVTGLPFVIDTGSHARANPWSPSIDRRDSSKGYMQDNCRIVIWMYNVAKSTWTDEEVSIMAKAITQ